MSAPDQIHAASEIERLRQALDAASRQRLELERKLDRANADFEEFVSMAAHNLRESLRDVSSFSQLLAETETGRVDAKAGALLDRIQQGAGRMQSLLADVVDYWSIAAEDREPSRTEMEAVLRQALLLTGREIAERGAIVTHDPLPTVMGDLDILTKVLHHLMRNAIQYCGAGSPTIHLTAARNDNAEWVLSVRDNGPGIGVKFQERIFGVFKRQHGREFAGNGLGLALCRKAIEWHGGRIWVESELGMGSTFHFTLPPAE